MPALLTRIETGPKSLVVRAKASLMESTLARSMRDSERLAALRADLAGQVFQLIDAARGHGHARSSFR